MESMVDAMAFARLLGKIPLFAALTLTGCSSDDDTATNEPVPRQPEGGLPMLGSDCDPLVPGVCGLPFPSDVYLLADPTGKNPSGKSVRFGATTLPVGAPPNTACSPEVFYDHDGWSPSQAPMTFMPGAACPNCATPYTIPRSLEPDSPTILLEAESGRRVPHWVDFNARTPNDGLEGRADQRLVMIRPAERLKDATRYIVALRDIQTTGGVAAEPSPVFRALRDNKQLSGGTDAERWSVYARRKLYADIFKKLESAGVKRDKLQIAWDYTTATKQNITGPMVELRDKALAVVGEDGPTFVVKKVTEYATATENPNLLRQIEVTMTVPLYLTAVTPDYDPAKPLDRLNRDTTGALAQNGTMDWDVLILVPRSVESGMKHGLLQNGHGLFGSRTEGTGGTGYLSVSANRNHYIAFAVNLFGFDGASVSLAAQGLLGRCEVLKSFPERQIQGMVNQLLAMRMMMGRIAKQGITDSSGKLVLDPQWIDASLRAYRGDSQGGIMGGTYMSVSTDVTRGLLGEPGMPYNLLLPRSKDYDLYDAVLDQGYASNGISKQLVLAMTQMSWDRSEPSGFTPYMEKDLLPNTPAHHVIMHVGRGDHEVTTFGAHIMARAIGAALLESDDPAKPVWESLFGIDQVKTPVSDRSVLVEYEFGLPPNPALDLPSRAGCNPHDRVRVLGPSYDQQDVFFRTGRIDWSCKGACNCQDDGSDPNSEDGCTESFANECK